MKNGYEWIKEVDYEEELKGDYRTMVELIGIDSFITLLEYFVKTSVYFSELPLGPLKKLYVEKCAGEKSVKEITRILNVSERFVYEVWNKKQLDESQLDMFNHN